MSTPKSARSYRRTARTSDRTKNVTGYRVEASWNTRPDLPVVIKTPDRKRAYRKARQWAAEGAYVIVQAHEGWDRWRTLDEYDGPAIVSEQHAVQQLAAEGHPPTPASYQPDAADRHRTWLQWMQAKAEADRRERARAADRRRRLAADVASSARELMTQPPHVRERTVRHVTGAQR
ncbi:hypothetical protein [Streptomyces nodosus]|uniref:hypothetical protein n=1 Tax=Streptomyces nodosus TaxID=40318 RepID=UPI0038247A63